MTDSRNDRSRLLLSEDAAIGRTVAYCGVLTALAMIFSYVETLIPVNFGVPGVKLGLANLVVLSGLYYLRPAQVLAISAARIVLTGFLFGNGVSILYSLAGGLLSFCVMLLLRKAGGFSPAGVSVAGGVSHNIGQLLIAMLVLRTVHLAWYLPVLLVSGAVTGLLMGLLTGRILKALRVPY
ncbi:MAG: Gx transporter family protein [Lachnospiraceae bacterium]|nr:Gx transporter family protein [Lachnospiraceae bacterium]